MNPNVLTFLIIYGFVWSILLFMRLGRIIGLLKAIRDQSGNHTE